MPKEQLPSIRTEIARSLLTSIERHDPAQFEHFTNEHASKIKGILSQRAGNLNAAGMFPRINVQAKDETGALDFREEKAIFIAADPIFDMDDPDDLGYKYLYLLPDGTIQECRLAHDQNDRTVNWNSRTEASNGKYIHYSFETLSKITDVVKSNLSRPSSKL